MEIDQEACKLDTDDPNVPVAVEVVRTSILPGILTAIPLAVRQPFKPVVPPSRRRKGAPVKTIGPKRLKPSNMLYSKFLQGDTNFNIRKTLLNAAPDEDMDVSSSEYDSDSSSEEESEPEFKPHEPLVVYEPTSNEIECGAKEIAVPPLLCQFLRPHQREGVRFVFECIYGLKPIDGFGSILADDMGLGKTLQSLTVLYTMLKNIDAKRCGQTFNTTNAKDKNIARRCVVVCPCSLVKNWQDEFDKWINNRAKDPKDRIECMALAEASRKTVEAMLDQFLSPHSRYDVLVISYETFRAQAGRFVKRDQALAKTSKNPNPNGCIDLLICDEAHRLKNADALTSTALASLKCKRRVLLSGTPMQNNLTEFFAMVNFTNPGLLGTKESFSKRYERPVLRGREPDATESERRKAAERQKELSDISNHFIIRRMNRLNARHLPPKLTQVICCRLTPVQKNMYQYLLKQREKESALEGAIKDSLGYVQLLQKVCNHPSIVCKAENQRSGTTPTERDTALIAMMPTPKNQIPETEAPRGRGGRVLARHFASAPKPFVDPELSGKMLILHALMKQLFLARKERIVVISVFMTTLDLIETLCEQEGWPSCKLGGSTPAKKRKQFNDEFNNPNSGYFAFLLSSKAGGCGLNLIGGSRLVMFDLDWNPATDKQAAARCWRDGQKLQCYTYRFVSTGTLEERMLQRQLAKEGLQNVIQDEEQVNHFATDDLKRLFCYRKDTVSDLHDELQCAECKGKHAAKKMSAAMAQGDNRLSEAAATLCAERLRTELSSVSCAAPFFVDYDLSTIDKENNPNAFKHAKKPTDLRTVFTKLDNRQYPKISDVLKDLRLVARTARKIFVDKNHSVHKNANDFEELVNNLWPDLALKLFEANAIHESCHAANIDNSNENDDSIPADAPPYKKQIYPLPKEEDLNNWSHHSSISTIADPVLRKAMRQNPDAISFVFGMYQDWDLIQAAEALEKKQDEAAKVPIPSEQALPPSIESTTSLSEKQPITTEISSLASTDNKQIPVKTIQQAIPMDMSPQKNAKKDDKDSSSSSSSSSSDDDDSSSSSSSDSEDEI